MVDEPLEPSFLDQILERALARLSEHAEFGNDAVQRLGRLAESSGLSSHERVMEALSGEGDELA